MKKHLLKILLFIISASTFSFAYFVEFNFLQHNDQKIDANKIQNILYKKEKELNSILKNIGNKIDKATFNEVLSDEKPLLDLNEINEKGFRIFIYKNDSLRFWSDNSVDVANRFSISELEQKVINSNNGWYVVCSQKINDLNLVGLILVKNQYSFKNDFLRNEFHKDFKLPPTVNISYVSLSYSKDIYDQENNFMFALIPQNSTKVNIPYAKLIELGYILGLIFFLMFLHRLIKGYKILIAISSLLLIGARFAMLYYKYPFFIYRLPIFGPDLFADSVWLPSLGDFLVNAILLVFIAYNAFVPIVCDKIIKMREAVKTSLGFIYALFSLAAFFGIYYFSLYFIKSLIFNSNLSFEVFKILSIDFYSFIGYIIIALLLASLTFFLDKFVQKLVCFLKLKYFIVIGILLFTALYFTNQFFKLDIRLYAQAFPLIILSIISFVRFRKAHFKYYTIVLLIFFVSLFTVVVTTDYTKDKQKGVSKLLVSKLVTERDPIAEHLLRNLEAKVAKDTDILSFMDSHYLGTNQQAKDIVRYLQKNYFYGYWDKYELEAFLCGTTSDFDPSNELKNCEGYFRQNIINNGTKIPLTNFFYIENQNRSITYHGFVKYFAEPDSAIFSLFISLSSKVLVEEVGYPELLLDKKVSESAQFSEYSYAKYRDDTLVIKSGHYPYDLVSKDYNKLTNKYNFINQGGYEHVVYRVDNKNLLILSKPSLKTIDSLVSFSYIFVFFNIFAGIGFLFYYLPTMVKGVHWDFRTKLQTSLLFILFLSILLVGGGTIYYNVKQYEAKHKKSITEKIQSIAINLEQIFAETSQITPEWKKIDYVNIDEVIRRVSLVFMADVNLYNLNGDLLRSSRPEVFERGLVSKRMNPIAFSELQSQNKAKFVHQESIGDLTYTSAYVPFKNQDNKILAYLNLPYFTKPGLLKKEISTLLVAIVNLYVILFLIAIVIAMFISNKVTQPLRLLENKFKEVELGKKYEQIEYKGKDEIGSLVKEYNRMVVELAENVELLAKSERESAWREMAKQIAHEIKNPLTPMKLSVQFLTRSWKDRDDSFENRFERVTNTLVEQIDNLSSIAAEFSNFAKMPKANNKVFNLVKTLSDTTVLFETSEDATVELYLNGAEDVKVFADEKQVSRVFINLIKNGIQALPNNAHGDIKVELLLDENNAIVTVKDNGTGIPDDKKEAIFTPNFTTKSSGMGMGLAIVKNIIENASGKIWFETEMGFGTTFFVELPLEHNRSNDSQTEEEVNVS